jgi:hypothetical protein
MHLSRCLITSILAGTATVATADRATPMDGDMPGPAETMRLVRAWFTFVANHRDLASAEAITGTPFVQPGCLDDAHRVVKSARVRVLATAPAVHAELVCLAGRLVSADRVTAELLDDRALEVLASHAATSDVRLRAARDAGIAEMLDDHRVIFVRVLRDGHGEGFLATVGWSHGRVRVDGVFPAGPVSGS